MSNDLFVSYSRYDNEQGRITQLVERLKADFMTLAGRPLEIFIDHKIRPMEDWRHRILEELRESRLLLACISPAHIQSEYCEWEYNEYVKREVECSYSSEGVLPLYLEEVPRWETRNYEEECAPWVKELRRRQRYDLRTWDHTADAAFRDTDGHAQLLRGLSEAILEHITRREQAERSLGNLVDHNSRFIGRKAELMLLRDRFVKPGAIRMLTAIHGLGGMGKTSLATTYAHQYAATYGGGCWVVDCSGQDDLRVALSTLQGKGDLEFQFTEEEKADPDRRFERVLRELKRLANAHEPHRCLLLLDNVDRPGLLQRPLIRRLPSARWLHVLATTRFGPNDPIDPIDLEPEAFLSLGELLEDDALTLIEGYQPDRRFQNDGERLAALELVRLLGRFTLAVESAAVFLSQPRQVSCKAFLERLKAEGFDGLEDAADESTKRVDHGKKSLTATLSPTLDILEPDERLALDYAAIMPADCIAWEWLESLVGDKFSKVEMGAGVGHMDRWTALRNRLESLRLLTPTSDLELGSMHGLVQEVVRNQENFKRKRLRPNLIRHALSRCEKLEKNWRNRDLHWELKPLTAWTRKLIAEDPENGGTLESALGNLLREVGRFRDAQELLAHALKVTEELYGPEDSRVATCMIDLGWVERKLGNFLETKWLSERALAIDEQSLDPNHPTLARDYSLMGWIEQDLGNLAEAKRLFRKAVAISEEVYEPNHPSLAVYYSNLGRVEQDLGNLAEAKRLLRKAVAIGEEVYEPNHPSLAVDYSNLGWIEKELGNLAEARRLLSKAIAIDEEVYEPNHPTLAVDYSYLGRVEQDLGNLAEAKRLLSKAIAIDEEVYEPNHPSLAIDYSNLGRVEQDLGNLAEAKRLLRKAVAIGEEVYEPNHPWLAVYYSNLGRVEQDLGNLAEAKRLLERAVTLAEEVWVSSHHRLAEIYFRYGSIEKDLGNLTEAKRLLQTAIAIREQSLSSTHHRLVEAYSNLASVEQDLGNLPQAESLARKAVKLLIHFANATGHEHPQKPYALAVYKGILEAMGVDRSQILTRLNEVECGCDVELENEHRDLQ